MKFDGTVFHIYEGVLCKETFEYPPLGRFAQKKFVSSKQENGEKKLEKSIKKVTSSIFSNTIKEDVDYEPEFKKKGGWKFSKLIELKKSQRRK